MGYQTILHLCSTEHFSDIVSFLQGRWTKADSHQVPKIYFWYFIGRLNIKVNAVRDVSHKSQPRYQGTTRRISYKTYDLDPFIEALEKSKIHINTEIILAGNKQCMANSSAAPLSAEEEILRAKDRAYAPPCPPTKQQTIIKVIIKVFIGSWIW